LAIDAKNADPIMIVIATSAAMNITLNRVSGVALLSIAYSIAVPSPTTDLATRRLRQVRDAAVARLQSSRQKKCSARSDLHQSRISFDFDPADALLSIGSAFAQDGIGWRGTASKVERWLKA
jgi:hypothetical protein